MNLIKDKSILMYQDEEIIYHELIYIINYSNYNLECLKNHFIA